MSRPGKRDPIKGTNGTEVPVVYTLASCPACRKLKEDWTTEKRAFEERQVDQSQDVLDEALVYGDMVPIVVYPDKRVEIGYKGMIG